jgi:hypothetical protein
MIADIAEKVVEGSGRDVVKAGQPTLLGVGLEKTLHLLWGSIALGHPFHHGQEISGGEIGFEFSGIRKCADILSNEHIGKIFSEIDVLYLQIQHFVQNSDVIEGQGSPVIGIDTVPKIET